MAVAVVGILAFMVMPLPTLLLDLLLSFNITFSLIILLSSMYVQRPSGIVGLSFHSAIGDPI